MGKKILCASNPGLCPAPAVPHQQAVPAVPVLLSKAPTEPSGAGKVLPNTGATLQGSLPIP